MHNEHTTNQMIASFLSRKAEQFPDIFNNSKTQAPLRRPKLRYS